jgi:CRISPR-associated protein Cas5h
MSKLLIFDIWGEYAHFRKPYTTTSPLTYSIPSRTAITGIVGAIIGIEKEKNNIELNYEKCNLSLKVINPVKKVLINQNLINTKTAEMMSRMKQKGGRTQIRFETLKDVKYRVYIEIFDSEKFECLKENLIHHKPHYSICFGISEHIANFQFIGEFEYTEEKESIDIDSVINLGKIKKEQLIFEDGKEYFADTYSLEMKENREVSKYGEILIERTGKSIKIKNSEYIKIKTGENIIWI